MGNVRVVPFRSLLRVTALYTCQKKSSCFFYHPSVFSLSDSVECANWFSWKVLHWGWWWGNSKALTMAWLLSWLLHVCKASWDVEIMGEWKLTVMLQLYVFYLHNRPCLQQPPKYKSLAGKKIKNKKYNSVQVIIICHTWLMKSGYLWHVYFKGVSTNICQALHAYKLCIDTYIDCLDGEGKQMLPYHYN